MTPILTDHSAFDAHVLLLEGAGRRILYNGDFRRHGRKGKLVDTVIARPPRDIDVLVCVWAHGHVHQHIDYRIGRTRIVCNARGHADERTGFVPSHNVEP